MNQTRTQSLFIWLETIVLAEEIWSEINYAARGAFWEGTYPIFSHLQNT